MRMISLSVQMTPPKLSGSWPKKKWVLLYRVERALKCIINWGQIIFATVTKETSIAIVTAYVKMESYD